MAVGLRTRASAEGVASQTFPLIASAVAVNFGMATTACSCVSEPAVDCPGLPNSERYPSLGAKQNRVGRGLLAMAVDVDPFAHMRPPRVNKGAYDYEGSEKVLPDSSKLWSVIVKDPASGERYNVEIAYPDNYLTEPERNTIALSIGMLPARDRTELYEKLRSAHDRTAKVHLLAGAVLAYTRATASLAAEIRTGVRLYDKITTDLVDVTEVNYTSNSVRMTLKFNATYPEDVNQTTQAVKKIYREMSKEADCNLEEKGNCPAWVRRLALVESQFFTTPHLRNHVWEEPTSWELE